MDYEIKKTKPKELNKNFFKSRLFTYLMLIFITLLSCLLAYFYTPDNTPEDILAVAFGYEAFLLLAVTLLIGPLNMLRKRRNPVNINLRRDIGIWSAITGCLHVFFALQVYEQGNIISYFFRAYNSITIPRLDVFGLSNYVGVVATVLIFMLAFLSNDFTLRGLKGKLWKSVQRTSYLLFALVVLHTCGYQYFNQRPILLLFTTFGITGGVIFLQSIGALVYSYRDQHRHDGAPVRGGQTVESRNDGRRSENKVNRRYFMITGGATILTGLLTMLTLGEMVALREKSLSPDVNAPVVDPALADTPLTPTPSGRDSQTPPRTVTGNKPVTGVVTPQATPIPKGKLVTNIASVPLNSALNFRVPGTGESAILIHEVDGSVKAFSNICTHRPYNVQYDTNAHRLVCKLHDATFDCTTGVVTRSPARRPLKSFNMQVDPQGNIMYIG